MVLLEQEISLGLLDLMDIPPTTIALRTRDPTKAGLLEG